MLFENFKSRRCLLQNLLGILRVQLGVPTSAHVRVAEDAIPQVCLAKLNHGEPTKIKFDGLEEGIITHARV